MEGCLLCLEVKKEFVDSIFINSHEWQELNVKSALEKYFWPMNHIEVTSWICNTCWRELYGFHKFYMRIQKTHRDFGVFGNNEADVNATDFNNGESAFKELAESPINALEENPADELKESSVEELKDILNEYDLSDNHFQMNLIIEDQKPLIKHDLHGGIFKDNNPLEQRRKRGRPRKNTCNVTNVALNNTKKGKKRKIEYTSHDMSPSSDKRQNVKKSNGIHKENIETISDKNTTADVINAEIKRETNFLPLSLKNNDTDRESLHNTEIKCSIKTNCSSKVNHNEKDKFLADNFKITCFLCNIHLETFFNMRKHFEVHHAELGHVKCCNKKFYRRSILVDHVHYHLNPNYFKCSQCGKVMADRRCLELHVQTHESNHEKNHCCDICGKGFAKLGVLKKHRMIHLSEKEKRFSCSDCGKNFASNYLRSSHYRSVHLKKYAKICDICGKSIRSKDVFERHMLQHEGKTAPSVSCDICGLLLTDKKALKRHKDIIHPIGGQHEYTCSICSKTSPNLRAHKRHVQYKHVMGYDHKCTICNKAFKRAPTLKEHMASHTGTILYTCPWCPKTFNSNANMHNHRKRMHPKEWEEASRKRYSGNLPPNYKPPTITESTNFIAPLDI